MAFFWHWVKGLVIAPGSQLVHFGNSDFKTLASDQKVEEEAYNTTSQSRYYPMRIGDVLKNEYQVVGKLGYGLGSTVWLANEWR